jgi:hypothetical protein
VENALLTLVASPPHDPPVTGDRAHRITFASDVPLAVNTLPVCAALLTISAMIASPTIAITAATVDDMACSFIRL